MFWFGFRGFFCSEEGNGRICALDAAEVLIVSGRKKDTVNL